MFRGEGPIAVLRFLCENGWKGVAVAAAAAGHVVGVAVADLRVRVAVVAAADAAAAYVDAAAPEASNASDPALCQLVQSAAPVT